MYQITFYVPETHLEEVKNKAILLYQNIYKGAYDRMPDDEEFVDGVLKIFTGFNVSILRGRLTDAEKLWVKQQKNFEIAGGLKTEAQIDLLRELMKLEKKQCF